MFDDLDWSFGLPNTKDRREERENVYFTKHHRLTHNNNHNHNYNIIII
jgi:hypothetical protein